MMKWRMSRNENHQKALHGLHRHLLNELLRVRLRGEGVGLDEPPLRFCTTVSVGISIAKAFNDMSYVPAATVKDGERDSSGGRCF